jgi:uncharacterized CHY-type Zn-finger protein
MGACDDWVEFDGKLSQYELDKMFKEHQQMCASEDGNSYSGRLNMCNGLKVLHSTAVSYSEAESIISNKFEKGSEAIAIRYRATKKYKDDAAMTKLRHKFETLTGMLNNLNATISTDVGMRLKETEFIKCGNCKSRMDTRFRSRTLKCPICDASFATKTQQNKRISLNLRLDELSKKIAEKAKVLQEKADKKSKDNDTRWLIGGLCSS